MTLLALSTDRRALVQLYLALRDRRLSLERVGERMPRDLVALEREALQAASIRHEPPVSATAVDDQGGGFEGGSHDRRFASQQQAALELGVGVRTVQRWIANGDLATVLVNGRRRITLPLELRLGAEGHGGGEPDDRGPGARREGASGSPLHRSKGAA